MLLRWVSMCVWAGVAASAVFWGMRLFTKPLPVPPQTQVADSAGTARGDLSRVLGVEAPAAVAAAAPEPTADARFSLVGVVSPRGSVGGGGVALISVDGKPPKAFKQGAVVDGQNVLQTVSLRGAALGPRGGPTVVALNIPPPQPPAQGQLPALGQQTLPAPPGARSQPSAAPLPPPPMAAQHGEAPPLQAPPQIENNRPTQLR